KYQKEQLKNTAITERQIDMLNASISRVAELAGQEFEAVKSLAINDSDLNPKKVFEEYSAYDYGVISKLLAKWINFYESRQKVQEDKK
ncbi:single-stranded DNA-binding protein, partial [Enterococcus faecalis]|nr:single-stranded DNA-binding protein [Enterococcus faecalis]MBC2824517.1 single-stranded DNA-binding protein [Enterococcus faecalis]